jgi:hypothetical protein
MQYISVFILSLVIFSCKEDLPQAGENEIVIEVGQTTSKKIDGKNWTVSFISLDENSLCPKDVQCFWAGRIIVSLKINGVETKLGAGDLSPRAGETEVQNELTIDNVKITLTDSFDPSEGKIQWIRLNFETNF